MTLVFDWDVKNQTNKQNREDRFSLVEAHMKPTCTSSEHDKTFAKFKRLVKKLNEKLYTHGGTQTMHNGNPNSMSPHFFSILIKSCTV